MLIERLQYLQVTAYSFVLEPFLTVRAELVWACRLFDSWHVRYFDSWHVRYSLFCGSKCLFSTQPSLYLGQAQFMARESSGSPIVTITLPLKRLPQQWVTCCCCG